MLRKVDVLEFQIVQTISNKRNFDWFAPDGTRNDPAVEYGSMISRNKNGIGVVAAFCGQISSLRPRILSSSG